MHMASLPARDLRILDPKLSYPSSILGRERAIVVNLEHIKAIITAEEVLVLNFKLPQVEPFVQELKSRLSLHFNAIGQQVFSLSPFCKGQGPMAKVILRFLHLMRKVKLFLSGLFAQTGRKVEVNETRRTKAENLETQCITHMMMMGSWNYR